MRTSKIIRKTNETDISIELNIDGSGEYSVNTPVGFLTHMLESFARHGLFDITLTAGGDLEVDQHHLIEDCGICLGKAFCEALEDKTGIERAGYFVYPMDDALAVVSVDLSGRPYLIFDTEFKRRFCGEMDTDLLEHFFQGFATNLPGNIAVKMPYGKNDHHKIEAIFKAFAKAMKEAVTINSRSADKLPSTKGII